MKSRIWILMAFAACACSGPANKAAEEAAVPACNVALEQRYTDVKDAKRVVTMFVNNFEGDACMTSLQAEAQKNAPKADSGATEVYYFDCPGHCPKLDAGKVEMGDDYKLHCVARLQVSADGATKFEPRPFAQ